MIILGIFFVFLLYIFHLFLPFNYDFFCTLKLNVSYQGIALYYLVSVIFLIYLIYLLLKNKKFNYDLLFLYCVLWIANLVSYFYFNFFESIILGFFGILCCLIVLFFLIKHIKKINKNWLIYLIFLLSFYFYLLSIFFKVI